HGLMHAVELVSDRATKAGPDKATPGKVQKVAYENGAMIRVSGPNIILSPPLVLTGDDVQVILNALEAGLAALRSAGGELGGQRAVLTGRGEAFEVMPHGKLHPVQLFGGLHLREGARPVGPVEHRRADVDEILPLEAGEEPALAGIAEAVVPHRPAGPA